MSESGKSAKLRLALPVSTALTLLPLLVAVLPLALLLLAVAAELLPTLSDVTCFLRDNADEGLVDFDSIGGNPAKKTGFIIRIAVSNAHHFNFSKIYVKKLHLFWGNAILCGIQFLTTLLFNVCLSD